MTEKKEPKLRILETAISLFAQKGYAGVGVREIAREADVNISMISYYFNGKFGIMEAITNKFHDKYYEVIKNSTIDEEMPPEECVRSMVRNIVNFLKANTELTLVVFNALPHNIPDLAEAKAKRMTILIQEMDRPLRRLGINPDDPVQISIVGPALLSIILTHFRFKSVQQHVFNIEFDDDFYEHYIETVANLFLKGISGIAAQRDGRQ